MGASCTPCGGEVRRGVTSGMSRERHVRKNGIGGEVRRGVTSGVSCETSLNNYVTPTPHLHREYVRPGQASFRM